MAGRKEVQLITMVAVATGDSDQHQRQGRGDRWQSANRQRPVHSTDPPHRRRQATWE